MMSLSSPFSSSSTSISPPPVASAESASCVDTMGAVRLCVTTIDPDATAEGDAAAADDEEEAVVVVAVAAAAADIADGAGAVAAADKDVGAVAAVVGGVGVAVVVDVAAAAADEDDDDDDVAVVTTEAGADVTTAAYDGVMLLLGAVVEGIAGVSGGHSSSRWNRVHFMHPTLKWRSLQPPYGFSATCTFAITSFPAAAFTASTTLAITFLVPLAV